MGFHLSAKRHFSWTEVYGRIERFLPRAAVIYGVPRGGAIVAGIAQATNAGLRVTDDPELADVIVDDIIDSGRTKRRFQEAHPDKEFIALVDKGRLADAELGWVVFPWEDRDDTADIEDSVVRLLEWIGEDPTRDGLVETPKRFTKALRELTSGLGQDPAAPLAKVFDEQHDEIVCVNDMPFSSLCEHHLLGFTGVVRFAYIPNGKVVGLSKIPRMVAILAARPQVQERLTGQIVDTFNKALKPRGVMAIVEGRHSCMSCRGVRSQGQMITSAVRGMFKDQPESRAEAMVLLKGGS